MFRGEIYELFYKSETVAYVVNMNSRIFYMWPAAKFTTFFPLLLQGFIIYKVKCYFSNIVKFVVFYYLKRKLQEKSNI